MNACKYFDICPSSTGWCMNENAVDARCIPFILMAYKSDTDKLRDIAKVAKEKAAIANTGKSRTTEYRPCYVTEAVADSEGVPVVKHERKALFHRYGNRPKGIFRTIGEGAFEWHNCTVAIVDLDDGNVAEVEPSAVRFVPGLMNEYDFMEAVNEAGNGSN